MAAVGVGVPGLVDAAGVLRAGAHLQAVSDLPLRDGLAERCNVPVAVDNDANGHAVAEHRGGAAVGVDHAVVVTLGTGIGAGLIVDGRLVRGAHGFAGEPGHMVVDPNGPPCPCGQRGCWEQFASGNGLAPAGAVRRPRRAVADRRRGGGWRPRAGARRARHRDSPAGRPGRARGARRAGRLDRGRSRQPRERARPGARGDRRWPRRRRRPPAPARPRPRCTSACSPGAAVPSCRSGRPCSGSKQERSGSPSWLPTCSDLARSSAGGPRCPWSGGAPGRPRSRRGRPGPPPTPGCSSACRARAPCTPRRSG